MQELYEINIDPRASGGFCMEVKQMYLIKPFLVFCTAAAVWDFVGDIILDWIERR
jgi:hypothetical protein